MDMTEQMKRLMNLPPVKPKEFKEGIYKDGDLIIIVSKDGGKWHLSISDDGPVRYTQLKWARYNFIPDEVTMGQLFPPMAEFVNFHPNTFHLWEITK